MIDTHAHLNFPQFYNQVDKIIDDSQKAGVTGIVLASSNLEDSRISVELAQKYPNYLFASVGIHPQNTDPENKMSIEEQLSAFEELLSPPQLIPDPQLTTHPHPIVAIGETGLDFSPAPPGEEDRSHEEQEKLFIGQISLAKKNNLPLIIHSRKAVDETIKILADFEQIRADIRANPLKICVNPLRGVFHCYSGGRKRMLKILSLSKEWYFGFDGNLTYDEGLQNILTMIPEDRILIETDSPFLAPVPHRNETNTPAYLPLIQHKINEIFGRDLTDQILNNTQKLFLI